MKILNAEFSQQEARDVKIADLQPYDSRINVVFKVISKNEKREITSAKTGETHSVCDVVVGDETGIITMALWNEDIDLVEEGETAKIVNGHVNVFKTSMRLSKGKYGTLEANVDESIDDVNMDNDRSAEEHEPRRRGGFRGGRGGRGGGERRPRSYDRGQGRDQRW